MGNERYFTDDELKAMGQRTLDLTMAAIETGDQEAAKKLTQRMYSEFLSMHDLYLDWVTDLLSFIGRRFDDEVLYEAFDETVRKGFTKLLSKRYSGKSPGRKLQILAAGLRGHLGSLKITEDEEKFTITVDECPSGGRQIRQGLYDRSDGFLRIEKPQAMAFGRPDFPVYCAHCHFQNLIADETNGKPLFITELPKKVGLQPCRVHLYK
ncbi:MAG: hypothetical protein C4519_01575 [Desulfobacteraceae bacterium]|nr:MAG: hypothetical protein C4519_01575 [Desulfobacteraceae bacterium]